MTHPWATIGRGLGGKYLYFDAGAEIGVEWGRNLPHWRQGGVIYFTTFRTADSMPQDRVALWKAERKSWLDSHPPPRNEEFAREYHRRFTQRWNRWLDEAHGACVLKDEKLRAIVEETLRRLDGDAAGYSLDQFVIMPNHVHALVSPAPGQSLSRILRAWKSVSANKINKSLGRHGLFWQEESWDHIVRNPLYLEKYRNYILKNPTALSPVGRQPPADPPAP